MSTTKFYCPLCQQYIGEEIGLATRSNLLLNSTGYNLEEIECRVEYYCPHCGETLPDALGEEIEKYIGGENETH